MARFQFFPGDRQTDKTDFLTPLRACMRGVTSCNAALFILIPRPSTPPVFDHLQ